MDLQFIEYRASKILNIHKHVDGPWFWNKYTAHPYIGCRSGCEFCYSRGYRYLGHRDPDSFDRIIQVKTNAVELLRGELFGCELDIIAAGDWQQPAESRYRLSRKMLEVILEMGFPLFIVERSHLLTRDLDLLVDINQKSWVGVVYSISSLDPHLKKAFEPRSPGIGKRLEAMEKLAAADIQVGTALMPVLPFVGDDEDYLNEVIQATKDHGGSFVIGGGLTMDGLQAQRCLDVYRQIDPNLVPRLRDLYRWGENGKPNYSPPKNYTSRLGLTIRKLCQEHGLPDRMPRYILPGSLSINKGIAEKLFLHTYQLELEGAPEQVVWAYRKAAWTVDELSESIADIYQEKGKGGLIQIPTIGKSIASRIINWLDERSRKK